MRWVYQNPAVVPPLERQKVLHELLKKDSVEFLRQLKDLEKAQASRKPATGGATTTSSGTDGGGMPGVPGAAPDRGETRILEMIDKLMSGFEGAK